MFFVGHGRFREADGALHGAHAIPAHAVDGEAGLFPGDRTGARVYERVLLVCPVPFPRNGSRSRT